MICYIRHIDIKGFRSIRDAQIPLASGGNVLIGANGVGKSNFVSFLDFLEKSTAQGDFETYVAQIGGASDQLFNGPETTPELHAGCTVEVNGALYEFEYVFSYRAPDMFSRNFRCRGRDVDLFVRDGSRFSPSAFTFPRIALYQFHDTGRKAPLRQPCHHTGSERLHGDGGNLASVLAHLHNHHKAAYDRICAAISLILPDFGGFALSDQAGTCLLRWRSKSSGKIIRAQMTSDGSLRCFALATLLNLPEEMLPDILVLDEPELGLHPAAISVLSSMITTLARERQVLVCTQSPQLVDGFGLDQILVVDWVEGESRFRCLNPDDYAHWSEEYAPGEMWQRNVFGGRP